LIYNNCYVLIDAFDSVSLIEAKGLYRKFLQHFSKCIKIIELGKFACYSYTYGEPVIGKVETTQAFLTGVDYHDVSSNSTAINDTEVYYTVTVTTSGLPG